jgi:anionic cell wall polymer biosynthesis LytR-Cps2A-Psr (LCP) family protein
MHHEIGSKLDLIEGKGKQTLSGVQATAYARIRYTSGGDLKRTMRQRVVIEAMLNKAKSASVDKLLEICNLIFDDIATTLTLNEILDLAKDVTKYSINTSAGFPYEMVIRNLAGNGSTVVPVDLEANVSKLHNVLFGTENYEPSFIVQTLGQTIMDKTGVTDKTKPENTDKYDDTHGADGT